MNKMTTWGRDYTPDKPKTPEQRKTGKKNLSPAALARAKRCTRKIQLKQLHGDKIEAYIASLEYRLELAREIQQEQT